jgi:hypothetical protein
MAGERLTKLVIQASFSIYPGPRGEQAKEVRFRLGGQWAVFRLGGNPDQYQFALPDANSADYHAYMLDGITNLITVVRSYITKNGLPYLVSNVRYVGDDPNNVPQPIVEFDIEATTYDQANDLDFYAVSPTGWRVMSLESTIRPVFVDVQVTNATIYNSPTGAITLVATNGTSGNYTYLWSDLGVMGGPATRTQLVGPATYTCKVLDASGAFTIVKVTVGSDSRLEVLVEKTDNNVTLLPSGGLPGYFYAWADGPTTATRLALASGKYTCVVTDTRGASVTVKVTIDQYRFYWSQNPITLNMDGGDAYRLDPTIKPNLSFVLQVWLEKEYLSGVYEQIATDIEQPADPTGRTTFDVQALLDAYVSEHLPPLGQYVALRADSLFRRFYLKSAEKYGTPPVPAALSSAAQHYVVLGGLSQEEAAANTWPDYQAAIKPFLTWEPLLQSVLLLQPAYLYYMHDTFDVSAFTVWRRVRYLNGSIRDDALATVIDVRRFEVFCLQVSPGALGLDTPDVAGYDIWVANAAGVLLSQVRRYQLDFAYYPQQRFFLYTNSLGGVNTLAAVGDSKLMLDVKSEEADRPVFDPELGDTVVLDRTGTPTLSVATGKRKRSQVVADQDALLSSRVTLFRSGQYWPGRVKPASFLVRDDGGGLATLAFDYILTKQRRFSPRLGRIGAGLPITPVAGGEGAQP